MHDPPLRAIGVYGLGYVGCVTAACLASLGYRVVGVDVDEHKVTSVQQGKSPISEEGLGGLVAKVVNTGALSATTDARTAILSTDVSLVCVGTPSAPDGAMSTASLEMVTAEIGAALAEIDRWHVVIYRSTMLPGTCENLLTPMLEAISGKRAEVDFGVCVNPEFAREGSSVLDFFDPSKIVVGESDPRSGAIAMGLYDGLPAARFRVPVRIAEMSKYVDNSFHALKISFANEIGAVCQSLAMDSHEVMDIMLADTKLNISAAYLRPGFAFGGSCLPKDVRALNHTAWRNDVDVPLLASLLRSNESHLHRALDLVLADGRRRISIFGLSFKVGTDDLRESQMVQLAALLIRKGFDVKAYDASVDLSSLIGMNRDYALQTLPGIRELLFNDVDAVLDHGEVLIVGSSTTEVVDAIGRASSDQLIIDLVRLPNADDLRREPNYRGIGW
jgi:GDP-mannose 6-dehydrogenase